MEVDLSVSGSYSILLGKLQNARQRVQAKGNHWVVVSTRRLDELIRRHLDDQGRSGYPPPLSPMTKHIYEITGEPDGSGIVNHLEQYFRQEGKFFVGGVGIPEGKPTMIAKVQDEGAVIPVTEAMRGFLAVKFGIFLRKETTHIVIPGRNFWSESVKQAKREAEHRLASFLDELFNEV